MHGWNPWEATVDRLQYALGQRRKNQDVQLKLAKKEKALLARAIRTLKLGAPAVNLEAWGGRISYALRS
jgi:hypothetical protein